jgi:hypothetical protein
MSKRISIGTYVAVAVAIAVTVTWVHIATREKPEVAKEEKYLSLQFERKIPATEGIYPSIVHANGKFYVSYVGEGMQYWVKEYDENFQFTGFERQLTDDPGGAADAQLRHGDGFFYLAYNLPGEAYEIPGALGGDLILRKFDGNFNFIKKVIVSDDPPENEKTDDMFLFYEGNKLYVGSGYRVPSEVVEEEPPVWNIVGYILRIFNTDLNLLEERVLRIENYWQSIGASVVLVDDTFHIFSESTFVPEPKPDLTVAKWTRDWDYISIRRLAKTPEDWEYFSKGALFDNGRFFLTYMVEAPEQPVARGDVFLKTFDSDFTLLQTIQVNDEAESPYVHMGRVARVGDKTYVVYDVRKEEPYRIFVKEYVDVLQ